MLIHRVDFNYIRIAMKYLSSYLVGSLLALGSLAGISPTHAQRHKIPCEVALEKEMACSIGVCRGCVIKIKDKNGEKTASVCQDGPVFNGEAVVW